MPNVLPSNLDALIVTNPTNIFYLSGFRGFSPTDVEAILVYNPKATLITAKIYTNEAKALQSKDLKVVIVLERHLIEERAIELVGNAKRIGFEQNHLVYSFYKQLKEKVSGKLVPTEDLIESQRMIKTEDEIKNIEKAQQISIDAFKKLIPTIKAGQTEEELRDRLEALIKSGGADGISFETIVASGPNSGVPHHRTSKKPIANGEILLFDFGAMYKNYHADITRTIFFGKPTSQFQNIYDLVEKAQTAAFHKIKNGTSAQDAYNIANNIFKTEGVEKHFLHGLGHGIGLDVHEPPYLRATTNNLLESNMVFSVEPGLYFPWGGVRIEDLVVIRNGKVKVLGRT